MISDEDKKILINYRIEQAYESVREADALIEKELFRGAINRMYYSMFYILTALALKEGFNTSKHMQLIGWFQKNFIKEEELERKYGRIIKIAFENRTESDYDPFIKYVREDVIKMYDEMNDFLITLENYIRNK
jgi:uncharacterized protein (UPF0332 family)